MLMLSNDDLAWGAMLSKVFGMDQPYKISPMAIKYRCLLSETKDAVMTLNLLIFPGMYLLERLFQVKNEPNIAKRDSCLRIDHNDSTLEVTIYPEFVDLEVGATYAPHLRKILGDRFDKALEWRIEEGERILENLKSLRQ